MPASQPSVSSDVTTGVYNDVLCARCGYDLRTLQSDATCPECAFPIAESLRAPIRGLSSLPGVQRALKCWVIAALLCAGTALLVWLFLRFWFPLLTTNPWLLNPPIGRGLWTGLILLDYLGGLLRIASVLMLLRAIRSARTNVVVLGCYVLLALIALDTLAVVLIFLGRLRVLSPVILDAHYSLYVIFAPLILWLCALIAWIRLANAILADALASLKRAARVASAAIAILLLSSLVYAVISAFSPIWWLWSNPFWSSRFSAWFGNGVIEKVADAVLLAAVLPWIRRDLNSPR